MTIAIKRILTVIMWLLLMFFALVILGLTPIAFLIGIMFMFYKRKIGTGLDVLGHDLYKMCYTLDVLGNVTIFNWLWFMFKRSEGYKFGNINQTISEVLAYNHQSHTLTRFGRLLYNIINTLDPGHFDNLISYENKH